MILGNPLKWAARQRLRAMVGGTADAAINTHSRRRVDRTAQRAFGVDALKNRNEADKGWRSGQAEAMMAG